MIHRTQENTSPTFLAHYGVCNSVTAQGKRWHGVRYRTEAGRDAKTSLGVPPSQHLFTSLEQPAPHNLETFYGGLITQT